MKTEQKNSHSNVVVEQVLNNATSWIGHRVADNEDVVSGQTFVAPAEGDLDKIEVFSTIVTNTGKMIMTFYDFDNQHNKWGQSLGSASMEISKTTAGKWVAFNMPHLHLNKGRAYGFRIECPDTYIGVGEAASSHQMPSFSEGQEWQFTNQNKVGHSYSYFSLAFKINMKNAA